MERRGLNGAAAAQNLAHQTRSSKDHRDEASLRAEWRERARQYGIDLARPVAYTPPAPEHGRVEDALAYSVAHNTEREAVIAARWRRRHSSMRWAKPIWRRSGARQMRGKGLAI